MWATARSHRSHACNHRRYTAHYSVYRALLCLHDKTERTDRYTHDATQTQRASAQRARGITPRNVRFCIPLMLCATSPVNACTRRTCARVTLAAQHRFTWRRLCPCPCTCCPSSSGCVDGGQQRRDGGCQQPHEHTRADAKVARNDRCACAECGGERVRSAMCRARAPSARARAPIFCLLMPMRFFQQCTPPMQRGCLHWSQVGHCDDCGPLRCDPTTCRAPRSCARTRLPLVRRDLCSSNRQNGHASVVISSAGGRVSKPME